MTKQAIRRQPTLSIVIPTYNRKRWLELTLTSLIRQQSELPKGLVEIAVSDNCSTDDTWTYIVDLAEQGAHLQVHRNERNIGGEGNFRKCPELASGKYIWLLGDDDVPEPEALRKILRFLESEPDYLLLDFSQWDTDLSTCKSSNYFSIEDVVEIYTPGRLIELVDHFAMGFLSCWVGRREFFNVVPLEQFEFLARWGSSVMVDRYAGVLKYPRGRICPFVAFKNRRADAAAAAPGFNYFEWFFEGAQRVFDVMLNDLGYADEHVIWRKRWLLRRIAWKRIAYERMTGSFSRARTFDILRNDYSRLWEFWLLCVPLMYLPGLDVLGRSLQLMKIRF